MRQRYQLYLKKKGTLNCGCARLVSTGVQPHTDFQCPTPPYSPPPPPQASPVPASPLQSPRPRLRPPPPGWPPVCTGINNPDHVNVREMLRGSTAQNRVIDKHMRLTAGIIRPQLSTPGLINATASGGTNPENKKRVELMNTDTTTSVATGTKTTNPEALQRVNFLHTDKFHVQSPKQMSFKPYHRFQTV